MELPDLLKALGAVLLFFFALFIVASLLSRVRGKQEVYPFARIPVLTDAEQNFHEALRQCVPHGALLLMKVRLADFLNVTSRGEDYLRHFGRISQKHADFLLVDEESCLPLLVIELDDSTHRRNQRTIENDETKDAIYAAAELPILRIPAARRYDAAELRKLIHSKVSQSQ